MIGAYRQYTWIEGVSVFVRDLSISRSRSQRTLQIDFRTDSIIDDGVEGLLAIGNEFRAQIDVDGQIRDYYGDIASIRSARATNYTEFRVDVVGREDRLTRRRFSGRWLGLTAKEILDDAWAQYGGGLGLTFAPGAGTGPTIDEVSIEEGTLFELFEEIAKIADWAWRVENTEVQTWDPATEAKGRAIDQSAQDITRGTVDIREDAKRIQNSMRGVAYESRTIQQEKDLDADSCLKSFHFPRQGPIWEVSDAEVITSSGEELRGTANLEAGTFVLSSPYTPEGEETASLNLEIRRPVVFEIVDDASVATYGPRYGPTYRDDGGVSVEGVKAIMEATIERLKDPEETISLEVERWPFDPEIRVDVTLTDPVLSRTMVVDSVKVTSNGGRDATVALEIVDLKDRRAEQEPDPALVMAKRIEDLERRGFHFGSDIGRMLNDVGLVSFEQVSDVWQYSGEFQTGLGAKWSDGEPIEFSDDTQLEWSAG